MNRRQQLLETALVLFSEQGVDRASMRETGPESRRQCRHRLPPFRFEARAAPSRLRGARLARRDPGPTRARRPRSAAVLPPRRSHRPHRPRVVGPHGSQRRVLRAAPRRGSARRPGRTSGFPRDVGRLGSTTRRRRVRGSTGRRSRRGSAALAELLRSLIWGLFNEWRVTGDIDETRRDERVRQLAELLGSGLT